MNKRTGLLVSAGLVMWGLGEIIQSHSYSAFGFGIVLLVVGVISGIGALSMKRS